MRQGTCGQFSAFRTIQSVNCALLGDGMVGKTCLSIAFVQKYFRQAYTATVGDEYTVFLTAGNQPLVLTIMDTAGQSDFEDLRVYTYKQSDVLVLCFSVCDRDSLANVLTEWLPELKRYTKSSKRPLLLVGTQTDLRCGRIGTEVTTDEGQRMAKLIGAKFYVECSAKKGNGIAEVFSDVIISALQHRSKTKMGFIGKLFKR